MPYQVKGKKASVTDPSHWAEYGAVLNALKRLPDRYQGIGYVFHESDPFVGIDLDDCLDDANENPKSWSYKILERFSDTYSEISPSGLGLKIWCRAELPAAVAIAIEDGRIELYSRARYFTLTGNRFRNAPLEIEDHAADVLSLFERLTGRPANHREMPKYSIPPEGKIPKGIQHLTLVSLAGTLRRRRVCDEAITACLQAVNRIQCEQPGMPDNITRIVTSSRAWRRE